MSEIYYQLPAHYNVSVWLIDKLGDLYIMYENNLQDYRHF